MSAVVEMQQPAHAVAAAEPKKSLLAKFAGKYELEPSKMLDTLKATAFRQGQGGSVSNEQMIALLIVADQYNLNPFTKEIYAFPDKGGIVPVVGVDGWSRIINENPQFDGVEFEYGPDSQGVPEYIDCIMFRKDRNRPTKVREYMRECKRGTQPWQTHPTRMLRHKALIQCARVAFSYAGVYDQDEAEQIIEGESRLVPASAAVSDLNARLTSRASAPVVDPLMVTQSRPETIQTVQRDAVDAEVIERKPAAKVDKPADTADDKPEDKPEDKPAVKMNEAQFTDILKKLTTEEDVVKHGMLIAEHFDKADHARLSNEVGIKLKAIQSAAKQ